ncbi:hypothetical protein AX15_002796 [Amanita polypyramis BW_CC]|nr:hypothetical protein AX15_002796 [Amanita polypyramis BW_CC]
MAQAATMGPPLSPREPRRSGRRSAPFSSAASRSPDSEPLPRQKDIPLRPALTPTNSNSRNKRPKQEDQDDPVDDRKNSHSHSASSANGTSNGRSKRKTKERDKQVAILDNVLATSTSHPEDVGADAAEDEEQGITRCVCGSTEDDPDAGEFMVQCETCKVWQHGLCMGYQSEDQVHDDDYYCELCRPELHTELLKKLARRPRHSSTNSHAPASRVSRSHSPVHVKQPSKRRNTMNSRDAAFDESIKEIIEASAAEAAAAQGLSANTNDNGNSNTTSDARADPETADNGPSNRKKRKRTEDDGVPKKRTRSASTASDHQSLTMARPETPVNGVQPKPLPAATTTTSKPSGRNKRGGRKALPAESLLNQEGEEGTASPATTAPRRSGGSRAKGSGSNKRAPTSSHGPGRSNSAEVSRAYRNSHAYALSQQPLFTSWGLPDYLAHLEEMLPTDTPQPLEIRAGPGGAGTGRDSVERTMERGVKVKWPSKRMSVGDMNKRVRALVEWVGREQASALDRARRREALEKALKDESAVIEPVSSARGQSVASNTDVPMAVDSEDNPPRMSGPTPKQSTDAAPATSHIRGIDASKSSETMKMMEELMEELISFQERFGPGAKNRDRERRTATAS